MKSRRGLLLVALFLVAALLGGCGSAEKVGVVDVNKVMTESPKVQQFEEQLRTSAKELTDKLEQDKAGLSQEELQKRSMEISGEIGKQKQELSKQLNDSMDQALAAVAKEKGLTIILYKNGVAQGGTDVTDDVVKKMQ